MSDAAQRRDELKAVWEQASACQKCPQLAATRQTVVFGAGNADADLMFVGEAPGAREDERGLPFVGQAGRLLDQLLQEIGLARSDVFVANVLKCLRYNAPVQLGDGTWARIGQLVRSRYSGTVMSVETDGRLVPKRVTGWHASPLGDRSVYRLTYRSAKRVGNARIGIELTGDHPVLTEGGFMRADELTTGDRIATGQGFSSAARELIYGTLLGDGSISKSKRMLTFSHSARQAEYAEFKAWVLRELEPVLDGHMVAAVAGGVPTYSVVHCRTRAHRALGPVRDEFYRPTKAVPECLVRELTPRMLAVWFMDDGHLRLRPPRKPSAEIATVSFTDDDLQVLLKGLRRLGIAAQALRGRIHFGVDTTRTLSELIAPYVPPTMRYKLHPEVEAAVPFDRSLWEPGDPEVVYDEVEIEDISDRPRTDRTFFCIDVEDTHNFVTSGGVVHNCRPPGNRDPLPQEIDACQDYLFRQLELIRPKVVCSLGNFSTKLLRGDPTGITRLHGRDEIRTLGPRTLRLYPIFHPAAALYTPRMLETLREDFARLPELLALPAPPQPERDAEPEREPEPEPVVPEPQFAIVAAERAPEPAPEPEPEREPPGDEQLGLF